VPALQDVLRAREGLTPLRLEELSLRNNNLTAKSLRMLAPVIEAARFEIRDVDVSQNKLRVSTREDAQAFATFLRAFRGCELMRRLDLSGNDFSGPLAMEVFLRVYCEQQPVDASLLYYETGPGRRDAEYDMLGGSLASLEITHQARTREGSAGADESVASLNQFRVLKRQRGLRAIPYIILSNCQLDDAGALHLSYALEQHHLPQYLMTKLKDGSREAKRKEEDDANGPFGLVYCDNTSLSSYGARLLDYANTARATLAASQGAPTPNGSWTDAMMISPPTRTRKMSMQSDNSDRRTSVPSSNMLSLRKRLQRTTIEQHGVQGVQLWHAAMKALYAARVVLPRASHNLSNGMGTAYASKLAILSSPPGEPIVAVTETSQSAVTAEISSTAQPPERRADSPLHGPGASSNTMKLSISIKIDKQFERDARNPKGFPTWIWQKIIWEFAGGADILNDEQVDDIIIYARDRSNIAEELQTMAKGESHQVWHVLEQLDCFTYELKMATE
jgi:hypothetical protein